MTYDTQRHGEAMGIPLARRFGLVAGSPLGLPQEIPTTLDSPIPTAAEIFRFLFQVPQWIQIAGAVAAVAVGLFGTRWLWKRRRSILEWISSRSPTWKMAALVLLALSASAMSWAGAKTWDYTQHSNDFCSGCHVMESAFSRFEDSGHGALECHDCHQQPVAASMRQLVLWVLERPEEIGAHAPVSDDICVGCHIVEDPDSTWAQIGETAGHRIHMESDSTDLAEAACVTCHALEVHRFVPGTQTCGQAGCHSEDATAIVLGNMATAETTFHCVACHQFQAEVTPGTSLDEAREAISPSADQCDACHQTEEVQPEFPVLDDPHEGRCGWCHNPHEQSLPELAQETCTTSGCHGDFAEATPFHALDGPHAQDCRSCHTAHTWTAPTDCRACHTDLR